MTLEIYVWTGDVRPFRPQETATFTSQLEGSTILEIIDPIIKRFMPDGYPHYERTSTVVTDKFIHGEFYAESNEISPIDLQMRGPKGNYLIRIQ